MTTIDERKMYISVTGLKIKRSWLYPWYLLVFWRHATPAYKQALEAEGNLKTLAFSKDGYHHTITVWENQDAMRSFIYDGAHMKAIGIFGKIATGKTIGFEVDKYPGRATALETWRNEGRSY